jgi:hypothetical protein
MRIEIPAFCAVIAVAGAAGRLNVNWVFLARLQSIEKAPPPRLTMCSCFIVCSFEEGIP